MTYPKPWLAAVLGFLGQPLGMLYVARPGLAALYFFGPIASGLLMFLTGLAPLMGTLSLVVAIVAAIHAYRLSKRIPTDFQRPAYSRWYGMLGVAAAAITLIFLLRSFLFEPFHIPAGSMRPSFQVGQHVVVGKWSYGHYGSFGFTPVRTDITAPLSRGDVVVFDFPPNPSLQYIKRIIGLPGDVLVVRGHELSINGKEIQRERLADAGPGIEQYLESLDGSSYAVLLDTRVSHALRPIARFPLIENCQYMKEELHCSVPARHYFVLGDNRDNSQDSRYWGFVPQANIVGKVIYTSP
jgi:signal peptidase I